MPLPVVPIIIGILGAAGITFYSTNAHGDWDPQGQTVQTPNGDTAVIVDRNNIPADVVLTPTGDVIPSNGTFNIPQVGSVPPGTVPPVGPPGTTAPVGPPGTTAPVGPPGATQAVGAGSSAANSQGVPGTYGYFNNQRTGSQTQQYAAGNAPILQGATNGTIGPQGDDATSILGVNTAGTVRVNNLANLEALLNVVANGMEILGIAWGGPTMVWGFMNMAAGAHDALKKVLMGAAGVTGGLATPGCINWLVASARDANLFS